MKRSEKKSPLSLRPLFLLVSFSAQVVVVAAVTAKVIIELEAAGALSAPPMSKILVALVCFLAYGAGLGFGMLHMPRFYAYYDKEWQPDGRFPHWWRTRHPASPEGRIIRRRFWWAFTFPILASLLIVIVTQELVMLLLVMAVFCWCAGLVGVECNLSVFFWIRRRGLNRKSIERNVRTK